MDLDEAYGLMALPARILQEVEKNVGLTGIALDAWMSQTVLFLAAASLAIGAWYWLRKQDQWDLGKILILSVAVTLTLVALVYPVFWLRFSLNPPTGEILLDVEAIDTDSWQLQLVDTRGEVIIAHDVDGVVGEFDFYYDAGFGRVPSRIIGTRAGCKEIVLKLSPSQVFEQRDVAARTRIELACRT